VSTADPAAQLVALFDTPFVRALSERSRLEILRVLILNGPLDIERIAERVPQDRSVVSRHLRTLVEADLVSGERVGRRHVYRVQPLAFLTTLESLVAEVRSLIPACCAVVPNAVEPEPAPERGLSP
jgi:DNA-binding transcriptional ArsR family regulator